MGGFIKVSVREEKEIFTEVVSTNDLNDYLGNLKIMFEGNVKEYLEKNALHKSNMFDKDVKNRHKKFPFNYGYIFIDRVNKKLFYINDYSPLTYFSEYEFKDFNNIKRNNYQLEIMKGGEREKIDIREESVYRDFFPYYKLHNALPFVESINSLDIKIKDVSNITKVLNELMLLREGRKKEEDKENFSFSCIFDLELKLKDWFVFDYSSSKESYETLFDYLKEENILSDEEKVFWTKVINEEED